MFFLTSRIIMFGNLEPWVPELYLYLILQLVWSTFPIHCLLLGWETTHNAYTVQINFLWGYVVGESTYFIKVIWSRTSSNGMIRKRGKPKYAEAQTWPTNGDSNKNQTWSSTLTGTGMQCGNAYFSKVIWLRTLSKGKGEGNKQNTDVTNKKFNQ